MDPVAELNSAIDSGNLETVRSILDATPEIVNQRTKSSRVEPIFAAVLSSHPDHVRMVSLLLDRGANVNQPAEYPLGHTPLHFAVARYDVPLAKLLLEKGADVNVQNSAKSTPIFGVGNSLNSVPPASAFKTKTADQYFAERFAMAEELLTLLIRRGARIDIKNWFGKTPMTELPPNLQELANAIVIEQSKREKRGLAEVSVQKGLPQMITANISSYLDPKGKRPSAFLPGSSSKGGRKTRSRKSRRRRTLRKHK